MSDPYVQHITKELKFDVSNILWKNIPSFIKRMDSTDFQGSGILEAIVESYAVQLDTLKAAVDNYMEAKSTSYRQYIRDLAYPFTDELYSFIVDDLGMEISPELLGSTIYEDGSNIWRSEFEKEQWSLILQNLAYFYKHRGTLEGIRSLGRMFGLTVPGNDNFLVDPSSPTVTANPNWIEDWDNINSKFSLLFNRIYGDFPSPAEYGVDEQTSAVAAYPSWIKWGDQIGGGEGRFVDRFVPYMDVAERGVYTNVFLPYDKSTYENYQWITDRTQGQKYYEGIYNAVAQGLKGYGIFNHPDYDELHYGTAYSKPGLTEGNLVGILGSDIGFQVTFRPSTRFFFSGNDFEYHTFIKDENHNYYEHGSDYSGYFPSSMSSTGASVAGTPKVAPQRIVQMYPLVVLGKSNLDPSDMVGGDQFGGPSNQFALFYFTSEYKHTWDYLARYWNRVPELVSSDGPDNPWDSYQMLLEVLDATNFADNDLALDWWEFRTQATPTWLQNDASNWLDLISIGPKVYMPFDIETPDYWEPPYDENNVPLEPSIPVISFEGAGVKAATACPVSYSSGWSGSGSTWTRDDNANDNRWAYADPSDSEAMHGGGFVISTIVENLGQDVTNAFARCSHQAIIRQYQAELVKEYTNREGNLIKNRRIWGASDEASNWQYDNRYSDVTNSVTLYPSNYESPEGLATQHDLLAEHGINDHGGRASVLYDLLYGAKTPNIPYDGLRKFANINSSGQGVEVGSTEDDPIRYSAIPDICDPQRKDTQFKVTVVTDRNAGGTGPDDAQIRWYINGIRIWYADYRFTQMGETGATGGSQVVLADNWMKNSPVWGGDVLAVNHLPHNEADLDNPANYSRRWYWEASNATTKNFWGLAPDASNDVSNGYASYFDFVQKTRNPDRLSHITFWGSTYPIDRDSSVKTFVSTEGHAYYPYLNAQLLTDVSNLLNLYYPMTFDSRSTDYDAAPFETFIKERMTLHDYGPLGFNLYKEASNGINGTFIDLTHFGQGEVFYGESIKKFGGVQKGFLEWIFRDGVYRNQLMQQIDSSRYIEDVWRSPLLSRVPEYMMDDSSNLREEFWNYRSMRPVSELKRTKLIGESTDEYSSRMAKAEWMSRSRHLTPSGEWAGREIYTHSSAGDSTNLWHSEDVWAAQNSYDEGPSNPYWSNATSILKPVLSSMRPDPWNFLLKYASQGINLPWHSLLSSYEQHSIKEAGSDATNQFFSYVPRPIYDESHRIPHSPVVWTYGGIFMDHEGNDDSTLLGGTPTNPRENIMSALKGWLPRSAKKSWGQAPSEAWLDENAAFGIDADAYNSPHIHMHLLSEEDMVKATDMVVMPFIDPLQNDYLFIRVDSIAHSINNVLFALTLTPMGGVQYGEEDHRLYASIDGGLTWELVDNALPHHKGRTFNSTRPVLDSHIHPYGIFGVDYWIYTKYSNRAIGQDQHSWGGLSLFRSNVDYKFSGYTAITGQLPHSINNYNSLEVPLGFMWRSPSNMEDTSNASRIIDAHFLGSKHTVMDVGYGGGAILIQGSKLGSGGDYDTDGMNSDENEFLIAFGGAGHPFAADYYLNTYRGITAEYEVSNWDEAPIESVTTKPTLGHLGNRLGGGFFYGSRHMSPEYAAFPSGGFFGSDEDGTDGYGIGIPRNWGYDFASVLLQDDNFDTAVDKLFIDPDSRTLLGYPRFGAFGIWSQHPRSGKLYNHKALLTTAGLEIHSPYMFRGDSQYAQGEYQYTHYFDGSNAAEAGASNIPWYENGVFVNDPCNRILAASSVPGPSNGKYYNYGLNYPMSLVYPFGDAYQESYTHIASDNEGLATPYSPYYLPSNKYPKANFIPTLLGRDARIYNPLADDAFMNFASYIRFNLGPPDPSGLYDDRDVSNVYQGNFSQYPYLWNQWTRPINLIGGLYSRYKEIYDLINSANYINAGYTTDDILNKFFKLGYFNDTGRHPSYNLADASSRWDLGSVVEPSLIKVLDIQDILQPMKWQYDNVADTRTMNRIFKTFSGFANALTQSILTDNGTPRATVYQISPRDAYNPQEYILGRKPFALKFKSAEDGKDWETFRSEFNNREIFNSYYANEFQNAMEEFDTPTARLFFASAYDSDNNDIYVLGGVPNTFALGHGGFNARYIGGQTKDDVTNTRNLYDNNYFMRDETTPTNAIPYFSYDQTHLLEASSPFWGGFKGMKKVALSQNVMFLGPDATNPEVKESHRGGLILLDVSNAAGTSAEATQWLTAWGTNPHEDAWTEEHSPNQRIFGQLVYVKLTEQDVNNLDDAGTWLYYVAGTDNLTNLELMKVGIQQGFYSAGFYNSEWATGSNIYLIGSGQGEPSNSWWLTGIPYSKNNLGYSSVLNFDKNQQLLDPFFQYSSMTEASNIFPYANSGFIGTSIGLAWNTRENTIVDYKDENSQWPIYDNKWLFRNYNDTDTNSYDQETDAGKSRYHELEGPVNHIHRFKIKDADGNYVLAWNSRGDASNWTHIMKNANEPEYGFLGEGHGVIPGYFSPDWLNDKNRALANTPYKKQSGLFDHSAVVANDGSGKKLYVFGGNTSHNGAYDLEWYNPATYYGWGAKPAISGKGKPIAIHPFGDNSFGMRPIAGIGASSSRQMYVMDFETNQWNLGIPLPKSDQKIGAAKVPVIWRSRGPISVLDTLEPSNNIHFDGLTYRPIKLGMNSELINAKQHFRGFAYFRGGSSPVKLPCTEVSFGQTSDHEDWNDLGPFEWVGNFPKEVKWKVGINEHTGPEFLEDSGVNKLVSGFIGVAGLGPVIYNYRILPQHFDFGKWKWGDDPQDYMASPMRKIRVFMDLETIQPNENLDRSHNMVWNSLHFIDATNNVEGVDVEDYISLAIDPTAAHVYFDTWQKVGWGNDMILPPNPTQEWVGWADGNAGYRGMSSCLIPAADASNYIMDTAVIGDWIVAAGGYSDGIFTPETGNTKWADLNPELKTRRDIAEEINKNLGVTLNKNIYVFKTYEGEWITLPVQLPTPQVWGNVVWSPNLKSLIFHSGKQEVRTKGGISRLITQPDDELELGASDMGDDLLDNENAFYNKGNLGNFGWAGLYKNWREEDAEHYKGGKSVLDPAYDITSLMFTQPTLSMSWNPLAQIRWSKALKERAGSYVDYMKILSHEFNNVVNRKLGISTATGWNEIGGVETVGKSGEGLRSHKNYPLGAMDMHWWGYPKMHDWRAGNRYRAMVAPPPSEYMGSSFLSNILTDPSQSLAYNEEVDRHIWQWFLPHRSLMRLPYYISGWQYLFHTGKTLGDLEGTHPIIDNDSMNDANYVGLVSTNRVSQYFSKYCDIFGALFANTSDSLVSFAEMMGDDQYVTPEWNLTGIDLDLPIISSSVVKYPIVTDDEELLGNKWANDVYTPWHSMWERTSSGLGRSVREFGGASFDAWIGYIHGGGESYSRGWDQFRESDRKWYPRGMDLAPSEAAVFYAIGKKLYNQGWTDTIPHYDVVFDDQGGISYFQNTAECRTIIRFEDTEAIFGDYSTGQFFINPDLPFPDLGFRGGQYNSNHYGGFSETGGILEDAIEIPSDYVSLYNGGNTTHEQFRNTLFFFGNFNKNEMGLIQDFSDNFGWGQQCHGAFFYRNWDNHENADVQMRSSFSGLDHCVSLLGEEDYSVKDAVVWRTSDGDIITMGGRWEPQLAGYRNLFGIAIRTLFDPVQAIQLGYMEATTDCVTPKVNVVEQYSHPDYTDPVLVVAGRFNAATSDGHVITNILNNSDTDLGTHNNIAIIEYSNTYEVTWRALDGTKGGPSNHPVYGLANNYAGDPIRDLEIFDVSNDGSDHIVICGDVGIKYWDATKGDWYPLMDFDGDNPFEDAAGTNYGSKIYEFQTIGTDLYMVGASNLASLVTIWKYNNTTSRWDEFLTDSGDTILQAPYRISSFTTKDAGLWDGIEILGLSGGPNISGKSFKAYVSENVTLNYANGDPTIYTAADEIPWFTDMRNAKNLRFVNEVAYNAENATDKVILFGEFDSVVHNVVDGIIPVIAGGSYSNKEVNYSPWGYIRHNTGEGVNSVPLQNVHSFTDTVDYNAVIVSGYMSPFWSALEERMVAVDIDENDPVSSQMERFFGTKNKVSQDQDGFLSFEDVWDYARWSVERSGDLGVVNSGSTANVPRLILETSRKIFNNGKMFEVHFAPVARRNVLNGTEHYTHFVGFNGYYVTGLYNEDTAEYQWKSEDVFQVFASNPLAINPELSITSIYFADNIHETDKRGVVTFKLSDEEFENMPEGKDYQWAFYPRRPVLKEGVELGDLDIEIFSQEASGIDPSSLNMLRESMDFRPEEAENWRPLDFGVLNLEPIFNDSFVTTNEKGQSEMWLCGDHGVILHSTWDNSLTSTGDYIGFANFEIQNIDNAYARQNAIKAIAPEGVAGVFDDTRIVSLAEVASLRNQGFDIKDLWEYISGNQENIFIEFPSIASVDLKSMFFIGRGTATDNSQIGKYGWVAGDQGTILKTTDGGLTWTRTSLIDGNQNIVTLAEFAAD